MEKKKTNNELKFCNFLDSSKTERMRGFTKNFAKFASAVAESIVKIYGKRITFLQFCINFAKFLQKICNCTNLYIYNFAKKFCKIFAKISRFA